MEIDRYIEILEKYIQVNWNFKEVYEKAIREILNEYEKIKGGEG